MKQQYAVVVLFALIIASSMVSLTSYKTTENLVTEDVNQALAKALDEQQSDVISADTIQVFNSHLQIEGLRGNAVLTVDTKKGFRPRPQVSTATILSLSDQRPSMILWSMVLLWSLFCLYQHRRLSALGLYGGLALQDGRFGNANVRFMQAETHRRFFEMTRSFGIHVRSFRADCGSYSEDVVKTVIEHTDRFYIRAERYAGLYEKVKRQTGWTAVEIGFQQYDVQSFPFENFEGVDHCRLVVQR